MYWENSFLETVIHPWHRLPRAVLESPSLTGFKTHVDVVHGDIGQWKPSLTVLQEQWHPVILEGLSNPNGSMILQNLPLSAGVVPPCVFSRRPELPSLTEWGWAPRSLSCAPALSPLPSNLSILFLPFVFGPLSCRSLCGDCSVLSLQTWSWRWAPLFCCLICVCVFACISFPADSSLELG